MRDGADRMTGDYNGPERRRAVPATRRFVVIACVLLAVYVSVVFGVGINVIASRATDGDLRGAIRQITLESCDQGNRLRAEVGRPPEDCPARVARLPK